MNRKLGSKKTRVHEPSVRSETVNHDEHEDEIKKAIEASMRRFVENNRENIAKSSKEKTASASYCGGMFDMIMLIRGALGRFAVEQLLIELERWNRVEPVGKGTQVRVDFAGVEMDGLSKEDAKELGVHIAKWIDERKNNGKKQCKDPMFA